MLAVLVKHTSAPPETDVCVEGEGGGAGGCRFRLTLQVQFALWTLQQHRAHRVQVIVGAAAQRAGPRLRYLQKTAD